MKEGLFYTVEYNFSKIGDCHAVHIKLAGISLMLEFLCGEFLFWEDGCLYLFITSVPFIALLQMKTGLLY